MSELETLLTEIARLLGQAQHDDDPARLERTLTDGYARALSLEAEGSRLRRQIEQLHAEGDQGAASDGDELRSLAQRLEAQENVLEQLRDELGRLRRRHSLAVRVAGDY